MVRWCGRGLTEKQMERANLMMNGAIVLWVSNDGVLDIHERLHFVPNGTGMGGEIMLCLPEGEIFEKAHNGIEFTIDPHGNPPEAVAIQLARETQATLTVTAPLGFGLERIAPAVERVLRAYRRVKTQDFAEPISAAPAHQQAFFRELGFA